MGFFNNVLSQWGGMGPGMMWGYGDYGMGWFGGILMITFWVVVIVGLVLLVRWLTTPARGQGGHIGDQASPMEILKRRYAKGEIDKEEFDQKRKDLE